MEQTQVREGAWSPLHSVEAERAIIASALLDYDECFKVERIQTIVQPEDFSLDQNAWAYAALRDQTKHDPITLGAYLSATQTWEPEGGWFAHFAGMLEHCYTAIGVEAHARLVARTAFSRRLLSLAQTMARASSDMDGTPRVILEDALAAVQGLRPIAMRASGVGCDWRDGYSGTMR